MPAKVATRTQSQGGGESFEEYVVVERATGKRIYAGQSGVRKEDAERLAEDLVLDCIAVPLKNIENTYFVSEGDSSSSDSSSDE